MTADVTWKEGYVTRTISDDGIEKVTVLTEDGSEITTTYTRYPGWEYRRELMHDKLQRATQEVHVPARHCQ